MKYLILDTETTGLVNPKVCEIGWIEVDENLEVLSEFDSLINPEAPISCSAAGLHGIRDEDVTDSPTIEEIEFPDGEICLIAHNCVTGDHEVLTPDGWVRFDELEEGKEVMQWREDGELTFTKCKIVKNTYSGIMYKWDTFYHKGIYTPNHRVIYKGKQGKTPLWVITTAEEFSKKSQNAVVIPVSGLYEPGQCLDISENEARVMEMIRADANIQLPKTSVSYSVRFRFKKPQKVNRCKELLDSVGIGYIHKTKQGVDEISTYCSSTLNKICELLGAGKDKSYGSWVMNLSLDCRVAILEELRYWDGHKLHTPGGNNQVTLASSKVSDVVWVREMAVVSGYCSRVVKNIPNERGYSVVGGLIHTVTVRPRKQVKTIQKPNIINFTGNVYCVSVPTGAFLVRREGTTWVTGNCKFDYPLVANHMNIVQQCDSLTLAKRMLPDSPDHKLSTLACYCELQRQLSHRALYDCRHVLGLMEYLMDGSGYSLKELVEFSNTAKMVSVMPFGKHKGLRISDVPVSYLKWLAGQDLDLDMAFTLKRMGYL